MPVKPPRFIQINIIPVMAAFVFIIVGQNFIYGQNLTSQFYSHMDELNGMSYGKLMTTYWDWWINIPSAPGTAPGTSPFPITECDIKDIGKVVFLVDALKVGHDVNYACQLDEGKSIFFPLLTSEYDKGIEGYENATDQELADLARQENAGDSYSLKIDNQIIPIEFLKNLDTTSPFWNISTNQTGNHYDAPLGNFRGVVFGTFVFLKPFDKGTHEIEITASQTDKSSENAEVLVTNSVKITYKINVMSPE